MTKKLFDGLRLVAVALSLAGAAQGCGKDTSESSLGATEVGSIGFNLTLPNGAVVDPITYEITGPTTKSGEIPTSGTGTTFSATIDGLKAGSGYTITLKGKQNNGAADCFGTAMFSVMANQTTTVNVKLSCPGIRKGGTGKAIINGTVNICAVVDGAIGTPEGDGTVIALESMASDEDMVPGAITYEWTAPSGSGTFSSTTAASPKFTCAVDGAVKLTVKVSDTECGDQMDVDVTCKMSGAPMAGTGATGGAGTGEAGTGGAGSGGAGSGEAGSGGAGSGGEAGTGGAGTGGAGSGGGPTTAECRACENMEPACAERVIALESSAKRALAEALISCVRTKKCSFKSGEFSLVDCWCPAGATQDACIAGTQPATGDCKAEIEAAAETAVAADIGQRMTDDTYGIGLAYNVMICEGSVCPPPVCEL